MRLINTTTFAMKEFFDAHVPPYAILSHTWESNEVTLDDMANLQNAKRLQGFRKIQYSCDQARKDHLKYVWVDTCCIDKRSSAELQEAINSMYRWYREAVTCYVYLSDMDPRCPTMVDYGILERPKDGRKESASAQDMESELRFWKAEFARCKWFGRGWTLQELIAPKQLNFYGVVWNNIGTKADLSSTISGITHIDEGILRSGISIASVCIARRMSWAAGRKTTRIEDEAYALLGIMGVNMPLLYGEGSKAFRRLQEEIMKGSYDMSILAWAGDGTRCDLFASSPSDFRGSHDIVALGKPEIFELSKFGITVTCPLITQRNEQTGHDEHLAVLNCRREEPANSMLAIRLRSIGGDKRLYIHSDPESATSSSTDLLTCVRMKTVDNEAVSRAPNRSVEIAESYTGYITVAYYINRSVDGYGTVANHPRYGASTFLKGTQWLRIHSGKATKRDADGSFRLNREAFTKTAILLDYGDNFFGVMLGVRFYRSDQPSIYIRALYCGIKQWDAVPAFRRLESECRAWKPEERNGYSDEADGRTISQMQQVDTATQHVDKALDPAGTGALTASISVSEIYGEVFCHVRCSFSGKCQHRIRAYAVEY